MSVSFRGRDASAADGPVHVVRLLVAGTAAEMIAKTSADRRKT
jgi:hypothetical protein